MTCKARERAFVAPTKKEQMALGSEALATVLDENPRAKHAKKRDLSHLAEPRGVLVRYR